VPDRGIFDSLLCRERAVFHGAIHCLADFPGDKLVELFEGAFVEEQQQPKASVLTKYHIRHNLNL